MRDESEYYNLITAIIATPHTFMVQLDDAGIDFSTISPYELFLSFFNALKSADTSLVFGDLDLSRFEKAINGPDSLPVLMDRDSGAVIDRAVHGKIRRILREINHLEPDDKKPGNSEAKRFMLERARTKQRRAARTPQKSQLENLIVAMVNTEQFKYGYEETKDLTIYQFHASVHQIVRKINYDNMMIGCYAGTINAKELNDDQLNWIKTK